MTGRPKARVYVCACVHVFVSCLWMFFMIRVQDLLSWLDNKDLDEKVRDILHCHPNCGYKMMLGYLNAQGVHIQSKSLLF